MKSEQKEFTAWIPKSCVDDLSLLKVENGWSYKIMRVKGLEDDWLDGDWPPKKIKMTIELI